MDAPLLKVVSLGTYHKIIYLFHLLSESIEDLFAKVRHIGCKMIGSTLSKYLAIPRQTQEFLIRS